jgi:hypothetical protein
MLGRMLRAVKRTWTLLNRRSVRIHSSRMETARFRRTSPAKDLQIVGVHGREPSLAQEHAPVFAQIKKSRLEESRLEKFWPIRGPCQNLRDFEETWWSLTMKRYNVT